MANQAHTFVQKGKIMKEAQAEKAPRSLFLIEAGLGIATVMAYVAMQVVQRLS